MNDEILAIDSAELNVTPHILISNLLKLPTSSQRTKAIAEIVERLNLQAFEAETLVTAAADLAQLRAASQRPLQMHVGRHTFTYIEVDVVTWRIIPSPENVRFEDQRFGIPSAARYSSLESGAPVLKFEAFSAKQLIDELEVQSDDIYRENPHTKTIQYRGIEVGGVLSLARITSPDFQPVGVLDSTDGFSRTVGAHRGLKLTPRDVLLKLSNPLNELVYRKDLVSLRVNEGSGEVLTPEDEARLRSSVMPRAKVIIGYSYRSPSAQDATPAFDKARRTLVGHLHMAPQHSFSSSSESASKAIAIREALEVSNFIPGVAGLSKEDLTNCLAGDLSTWKNAGLPVDEFAVFVLEAYKPNLQSRQGRAIKSAIEDLTGQSIRQEELAEIAAEVALRPVVLAKNLQKVQSEQMMTSLRSVLSKSWAVSYFSGVKYTGREIQEIRDEALQELAYEKVNFSGNKSMITSSRAELATLASFAMVALMDEPLLKRAVGRKGFGNNDEPNKVLTELLRSERGISQLAQIILDVRAGVIPKLVSEDVSEVKVATATSEYASVETIRAIYEIPQNTPEMVGLTPTEQVNAALRDLNYRLQGVLSLATEIDAITSDSGLKVVQQDGLPVQGEIQLLNSLFGKLHSWNSVAEQKLQTRLNSGANEDDDLG